MGRTYIKKFKRFKWNMEDMNAAIKMAKDGSITTNAASKLFNVPRKTLTVNMNRNSVNIKVGRKAVVTESVESEIVSHLKKNSQIFSYLADLANF